MFEKNPKFRIRRLLEKEFANIQLLEKAIVNSDRPVIIASSPNERNMTRKTRSRQLRIHSAFQSGYCAICHIPYNSLSDHIQTKRHLKLIGDDGNFISLKGFDDQDTLLNLHGIDSIEVKNCDVSPYLTRTRMPRTRTTSLMNNLKDSSLSPTINDSGHHLRSRKHINYMTPPLEDDSLNEKPEIKEYRELRSSSRLLAKLTDQIVTTTDEVWNSGRPKRSCNRQRISADERLVADNKTYYKVEVLPSKLRSGLHLQNNQQNNRRAETPAPRIQPPPPPPPPTPLKRPQNGDKGLIVRFKKLRNSELIRLNNEAENFLFPKKDESCDDTNDEDDDDDDDDDNDNSEKMETEKVDDDDDNLEKNRLDKEIDESKLDNNSLSNDSCFNKKIKIEDEESSHSTSSEGKGRKRRRTHAEAFIMDNQKYYKFETPGSRLRYHGSYLSPVGWKSKNNGGIVYSNEKEQINKTDTTSITTTITTTTTNEQQSAQFNLNEINFSFESVPKDETWYKTFRRKDTGDEKYIFLDDDNYWDPLILPYQLDYVPPLDPKICFSTYNQIKKILTEPVSTSTSVGPSTPEPNTSSNSSIDLPQDEDSKISTTMTEISSTSTIDELKPVLATKRRKKRSSSSSIKQSENDGKNPRKSPRQHASTLAILSSLIQQRKRKSRREIALPTIVEEEQPQQPEQRHSRSPRYQRYRRRIHQNHHQENEQQNQQDKIDYFAIARNLDDELATILDDNLNLTETDDTSDIVFNNHNKIDVIDLLNNYDLNRQQQQIRDNNYCSIVSGSINNNSGGIGSGRGRRRITGNRPGRKPGRKKKKNRTGWPNRNIRRIRRDHHKDDLDDSTLDSMSVHVEDSEDNEEICENKTTDSNSSKQQQQQPEQQRLSVNKLNSENNNDQSSLDDCNNDTDERITKLNDLNSGDDTVLTDKVDSNVNMLYETDLCVQKLDTVDNNNKTTNDCGSDSGLRRSTSPKRTNRGQRRMPASPKSPRMLRRPRGRWYRER